MSKRGKGGTVSKSERSAVGVQMPWMREIIGLRELEVGRDGLVIRAIRD